MTGTRTSAHPLGGYVDIGAISEGDALIAARLGRIGGDSRFEVVLAAALCVAELRRGAVCLLLDAPPPVPAPAAVPPWPEPSAWRALLAGSALVRVGDAPADRPLRLIDDRLYLQRYWQDEEAIRYAMLARGEAPSPPAEVVQAAIARMFADPGHAPSAEQAEAARVAATSRTTLIAGGPGTGKTWTVAHILAILADVHGRELSIAVAAPTGKAAARLHEAIAKERPAAAPAWIADLRSATIHRLLRRRPGSHESFRFNRDNPLPHDVVVVDEMSMVSLPLMARLVEAVGPQAQMILVGDPDQLASVEAGAVFGDLVRMRDAGPDLVTLRENHRFTGNLAVLAAAVRDGHPGTALDALTAGGNVEFVESVDGRAAFPAVEPDVGAQAAELARCAESGDAAGALAALSTFRLLCAHRDGRYGVARWSRLIDAWSADATGRPADAGQWYPGRPFIVTGNDYDLGVFNGETGVVLHSGGRPIAVIDQGDARPEFSPSQLTDVESLHALTVHRAQGSQYRRVTVVLPTADSPLLTRELLYTAITRAQESVRIVGTRDAVAVAVGRRIRRASGLAR